MTFCKNIEPGGTSADRLSPREGVRKSGARSPSSSYKNTMHEEERWLLVKIRDEKADARRNPVGSEPNSAVTGRSLEEIEKDAEERRSQGAGVN